MSDLQKTKNINIPKKNFVTLATKFLQITHFFSTSNLIEIKQYQFEWPIILLAKLSLRNDYVRIVDLYKIKNQTNSHISYRQTTLISNIYIYITSNS